MRRSSSKRIPKPWGEELCFAENRYYAGKILSIKKGHRLSLQYHRKKHETIYVLRGRLRLNLRGRVTTLEQHETVVVPPRTVHRFAAPYGRVTLLEVSSPETWDIVRLKDDYGRSPNVATAPKR